MATNLYFSRDTRMFVQFRNSADESADTVGTGSLWEIPILDGFSFSQSANTSEVTLSEMESGGVSRRGRKMFTDSLAPAEWSFSTYIRPFKAKATANIPAGVMKADAGSGNAWHLVDEVLWAHMLGADTYASYEFTQGSNPIVSSTAFGKIDPSYTNVAALTPITIYFLIDEKTNDEPLLYKLPGSVVNELSIDFDVEGISTANWSGFAKEIIDISGSLKVNAGATPAVSGTNTNDGTAIAVGDFILDSSNAQGRALHMVLTTSATNVTSLQAIDEATTSTKNFIRNRVSSIEVTASNTTIFPGGDGGTSGQYAIPLTGGSFTYANNITFLLPEELGSVNKPLEHITGTRTITGGATCYLALDTAYTSSADKGTSRQFFNDLTSTAAMSEIINKFEVVMHIGSTADDENNMKINMSNAHFEVPQHNIEDVISLESSFHALPSDFSSADEISSSVGGASPIEFDSIAVY